MKKSFVKFIRYKGGCVKLKLRIIRKDKGLSVPELSKLSEVPIRTIEDIERRGDCKVSTAKKLAGALSVSLDELCGD